MFEERSLFQLKRKKMLDKL